MARKSIQKRRINRKRRGRGWGSCWGWVKLINNRATGRRWVKESMMITNNSNNTNNANNTNIYNNSRRWDPRKWTNPWSATSRNRPSTWNSSSNNSSSYNTTNPTTSSETTWFNCHYLQLTPNPSTTTSHHKLGKSRSIERYPPHKSPKTISISLMRYYKRGWTSRWWVTSRRWVRSCRRIISWVRVIMKRRSKGITITNSSITWWQCPGYPNWTRRRMRSII